MARVNEDAVWEWSPTGQLDEDGDDIGDYFLTGSEPLTPFEAMVFASSGAQCNLYANPYLEN